MAWRHDEPPVNRPVVDDFSGDLRMEITVDRKVVEMSETVEVNLGTRILRVQIPSDTRSGGSLGVRGGGNPSRGGGKGNLYIRVWVGKELVGCRRMPAAAEDGTGDIRLAITVDQRAVAEGADIEVDLGGRTIKVRLPKGIVPGTIIRARGAGNPARDGGNGMCISTSGSAKRWSTARDSRRHPSACHELQTCGSEYAEGIK